MPNSPLDPVLQHLADAGFALAEAVGKLSSEQQREALRVVRVLTETQDRVMAMKAAAREAASGGGGGGG